MSNYVWGLGSSRFRKSDAGDTGNTEGTRKGFFSESAPRPKDDQLKSDVSLRQMLEQVMRLPALPQTAAAVIQVADSADSSASDLKEVVSTDQALVARLLRVVNSPMYALRQRVTTVTHAIALLGFDAVKNLALAASFAEVLTAPAEGYGLDPGRLWAHSIAVGCASRAVAEVSGHENPEEAFVAGVIHDLGKLAIHSYVKEKYDLIVRAVRLGGRPVLLLVGQLFQKLHKPRQRRALRPGGEMLKLNRPFMQFEQVGPPLPAVGQGRDERQVPRPVQDLP